MLCLRCCMSVPSTFRCAVELMTMHVADHSLLLHTPMHVPIINQPTNQPTCDVLHLLHGPRRFIMWQQRLAGTPQPLLHQTPRPSAPPHLCTSRCTAGGGRAALQGGHDERPSQLGCQVDPNAWREAQKREGRCQQTSRVEHGGRRGARCAMVGSGARWWCQVHEESA